MGVISNCQAEFRSKSAMFDFEIQNNGSESTNEDICDINWWRA